MPYDIRLENVAEIPTAVLRLRANLRDLPKVIPEACGAVWKVIRSQQVTGAGRHVSLYLDDQVNLEVGVELQHPFAGHGDVIASTLPAGRVATTTHFGPYPQLHLAHQAIRDWCAAQGHTPTGVNWEIYGHWQDAWNNNPSAIQTDVFYLLA
jgi:effector-binding domain-containing protein